MSGAIAAARMGALSPQCGGPTVRMVPMVALAMRCHAMAARHTGEVEPSPCATARAPRSDNTCAAAAERGMQDRQAAETASAGAAGDRAGP